MARVPLSKTERKNLKAQRRAGLSGGVMLDDFADDVADLIQVLLYTSMRACSRKQGGSPCVIVRCRLLGIYLPSHGVGMEKRPEHYV